MRYPPVDGVEDFWGMDQIRHFFSVIVVQT